jgi:hypothetical protein
MAGQFETLFNMTDGDGFYQALIDTHQDLELADSHRLNARLVLMMANQIGDMAVLKEILSAARDNLQKNADLKTGAS